MKYWWVYLIVLVVIVFFVVYKRLMYVVDKLDYTYKIGEYNIDFSRGISNTTIQADIDIELLFNNKTTFSTRIQDLNVKVLYNNQLIAETITDKLTLVINPNAQTSVKSKMRVYVTQSTMMPIMDFIKNKGVDIQFELRGKFLNYIPIKYKGNYLYVLGQ